MTPDARRAHSSPSLPDGIPPALTWAIEAAQSKKASGVTLLDLREMGAFTDAFLVCSGFSARQVQAISDAIEEDLARRGLHLWHREGSAEAEWVLLDYGFCMVHIFHERARSFYDLERLWRTARRIDFPDTDGTGTVHE